MTFAIQIALSILVTVTAASVILEDNLLRGEEESLLRVERGSWAYTGPTGPAAWGSISPEFATCGSGKAQSPIDIPANACVGSDSCKHRVLLSDPVVKLHESKLLFEDEVRCTISLMFSRRDICLCSCLLNLIYRLFCIPCPCLVIKDK
jgi:hypothetical protein